MFESRPGARLLRGLLPVLMLEACRLSSVMAPVPSEARLFSSPSSVYSTPVRLIVRDEGQWPELWRTLTDASPSVGPPRPDIDFSRHMVLVAAAGSRPGGDTISIDSVAAPSGGLRVVVTTQQGCQRSPFRVTPIDVVRVPRVDGEVRFVERVGLSQQCARRQLSDRAASRRGRCRLPRASSLPAGVAPGNVQHFPPRAPGSPQGGVC